MTSRYNASKSNTEEKLPNVMFVIIINIIMINAFTNILQSFYMPSYPRIPPNYEYLSRKSEINRKIND